MREVSVAGRETTIFALCRKYYHASNASIVDYLLEFNKGIANPHRIRAGQKIKVPPLSEERLVLPTSEGFYKIRLGTFSRREYANRYENEAALRGKQIRLAPNRVLPGKTWYRATAGKFTSREQGLRAVRALRQRGLLPYFASPSPKKGGR